MTEEERKKKVQSREFIEDMYCGAAAALAYTDEEIYDTFCKEEAEEFIELRNRFMKIVDSEYEKMLGKPVASDDYELPMAAEDDASYN